MTVNGRPIVDGPLDRAAEALLRPGETVAVWLSQHAPAVSGWLSGLLREHLTLTLAAVVWIAALLALYWLGRRAIAALYTVFTQLRISTIAFAHHLRNSTLGRVREALTPSGNPPVVHEEIELSELDLGVLKLGAALPPGLAISVIDLAEQLGQRPSQIERSLVRLRRHQLVDPLLGATDGFDDYRLTDSGAWFISTQLAQDVGTAQRLS